MKPSDLQEIPPWEWPDDAGRLLLRVLRDERADRSELLTAAELAGDLVVIDDEIARTLVAIVGNDSATVDLRQVAAIALGPSLEEADLSLLDDVDDELFGEEPTVSIDVIEEIQDMLHRVYRDETAPRDVRRAALEAAVRAPQEWHPGAVSKAIQSDDRDWRLTGIFCTRYIPGFDEEILDALGSDDPDIAYEAVSAAGVWGIRDAWSTIASLVSESDDKELRLAAIEASATVAPNEATLLLRDLADSEDDEDIQEAIDEALMMCSVGGDGADLDDLTDFDDDEDDDWLN